MSTAEVHLLGSVTGYTTLGASPGLAPEERVELERLVFGQSDDPAFHQSLLARPAAIARPLSTGRVALTRCLPGEPDDLGRATLRYVTLVVSPAYWAERLSPCMQVVLENAQLWRHASDHPDRTLPLVSLPLQPSRVPTNASLALLDAWLEARRDTSALVALTDTPDEAQMIYGMLRLVPTKERASVAWGVRVLNSSAPVQVAALAVPYDTRRRVLPFDASRPLSHPYTQALVFHWRQRNALPEEFIAGAETTASAPPRASTTPSMTPPAPAARRKGPGLLIVLGGLGLALIAIASMLVLRQGRTADAAPVERAATVVDRQGAEALATAFSQRAAWDRAALADFITNAEAVLRRAQAGSEATASPSGQSLQDMLDAAHSARDWLMRTGTLTGPTPDDADLPTLLSSIAARSAGAQHPPRGVLTSDVQERLAQMQEAQRQDWARLSAAAEARRQQLARTARAMLNAASGWWHSAGTNHQTQQQDGN